MKGEIEGELDVTGKRKTQKKKGNKDMNGEM